MPLSFLNPALLFGLAGAAVPVIIHFLSRRRTRRVVFSDLRFLEEEESQQARRRGVQRWLLLLLRVLIICCLALAAARPHWGGLPGSGGRAVLLILDASASMQVQQDDGRTRFQAAVDLAGEMLETLPGGSSVHAVIAGAAPRPLLAAWLPAGGAAREALGAAAAADGPCDLAAALRTAAELVREAPVRPVEVVLISDLQVTERPDLDAVAAALDAAGGRLLVRRLGDGVPGGAVLDVALPPRALRPGEAVEVTARVRPERAGQPFWLELDGRRIAETLAPDAPAGGVATLAFPLAVPAPGLHHGRVGKDPDRLPVDDVRPFVLTVPARLEVLLAHGDDRDALGRGGWRYLSRALDPAADGQGLFRVRAIAADSLRGGDLAGVDLLVLVDPDAPGRRLGDALSTWLEAGGALLAFTGDGTLADAVGEGLLPLLGLPRQATWTVRAPDQAERVQVVDAAHPVLADLGPGALDALAAARWFRYLRVDEGAARVILAADSGAPLLLEGEREAGRWALAPFHLRREATDVMLNPVFLPLVQRIAARLVEGDASAASVPVGEVPGLRLRRGAAVSDLTMLRPPSGREEPATLSWQGWIPVVTGRRIDHAGLHVFRAGQDTLGAVAAAVPAAESQPRVLEAAEFADRLRIAGLAQVLDLGESGAGGLARALAGRDLTRWLLVLALIGLALEVWLGRSVRRAGVAP